ncbi:GNAT family N-acetyltransferase [Flavobacterium paronense]|uniref:GNAT family N-acetyltransferase n=1 Tax=Flavobacterium paronense TaxID=1392775 RepID=A0ABV5GAN0_9FLAO|nr:GNAT family N-acetyltransferase [Flavobacterium paronense]MDN3676684.1 GNAT family N-acetyltransferase [Flavobacterium paronense]
MEIRDYKKGDEIAILSLFEKVFKVPMSLPYWQWRFENNPAGQYFIKLMWDGDSLVGHYAVSPVYLLINNQKCLTTLSMTTMTHPDYAGRGIFKDLAVAFYDQLENEKGVVAIWGYPNSNSHYGFIKNLGWKDLSVVHSLSMPTTSLSPKSSPNVTLVHKFTDKHVKQLSEFSQSFAITIDRDLTYLNWRYVQNPSKAYRIFEYANDKNEGFVVVKIHPSAIVPDTWEIYILELGINDISIFAELFEQIIAYYEKPISRINIWISLWDKRHIQLEKIGFAPFGKQTFLGARFEENTHALVGDFKNWYYSYGDSDVY